MLTSAAVKCDEDACAMLGETMKGDGSALSVVGALELAGLVARMVAGDDACDREAAILGDCAAGFCLLTPFDEVGWRAAHSEESKAVYCVRRIGEDVGDAKFSLSSTDCNTRLLPKRIFLAVAIDGEAATKVERTLLCLDRTDARMFSVLGAF